MPQVNDNGTAAPFVAVAAEDSGSEGHARGILGIGGAGFEYLHGKLRTAESAVAEVYEGINQKDFNAPPDLEGNDPDTINAVCLGILVVVGVITLIAAARDFWVYCRRSAAIPKGRAGELQLAPSSVAAASQVNDRPWAWAAVLMFLSYCALIPGLFSNLISMTMVVNVVGHRIAVHPESGRRCFTEDSPGLARMLYEEGSLIGAGSVVLMAVVLPLLEVIFVCLGMAVRGSCGEAWNRRIRVMIYYAQHKSKWSAPYMSALIVLVCLVRRLNHPDLILFNARLDIGFFCFGFFCIGATASAIGFPELATEDRGCCSCCSCCGQVSEWLEKRLASMGRRKLLYMTWFVGILFFWLLERGCHLPAMHMSFTDKPLFPPQGSLPLEYKSAVERLGVIDLMATAISFQETMEVLYKWAMEGEVISAVGLALLAVFTILIPLLDVVVVSMLASLLYLEGNNPAWKSTRENMRWVIEILKRLSMLDVSILGIYVISAIMLVFKARGITIIFGLGHLYLHVAEVAHWLMHRLVSCLGRDDESLAKRPVPQSQYDYDDSDGLPLESISGCCSTSRWGKWPIGRSPRPRRGGDSDLDAFPLTEWPSRGEGLPSSPTQQPRLPGQVDHPASLGGASSPGKRSAWLPFQADVPTSPGSSSASFLSAWSPVSR